ncbi:MAG: hypothetical protein M0Q92_11990 [Methanoregula sp.]|jgi:hypothetical protein|nr:hypothetical protein [Methanoregula sp.]
MKVDFVPMSGDFGENVRRKRKMSQWKTIAVLLTLMLAAMVIVPCVSAGHDSDIQKAIFPVNKVDLASGDNQNLFDVMGLEKSQISHNPVSLKRYNESKSIADRIMKKAVLLDSEKSVIGVYDFGNSQILLISRNGNILEVVDDGKSITTHTIVPELIGEREKTYAPNMGVSDGLTDNDGMFETRIKDKLYSFSVQQPDSSKVVLTTYAVTRERTDSYVGTQTWVTAKVKGTFYINPDVSIIAIQDESSYNVVWPYQYCEFIHSTSGVGTVSGQVNNHVKAGLTYVRIQIDNWVGMDAFGYPSNGGSAIKWTAATPDGCV